MRHRTRSSDADRRRCESRVDELHGHRSFADRSGTALGRAGADVAGGEDALNARLERELGAGRFTGEDEAVGVARNCVVEPRRARSRAEEEKEEREREALAALQRDRLELSAAAVKGGDLAAVADGDAV